MEKRRMLTIGEQTGIKELDDVRQCGFDNYNLYDVLKILGVNKCVLKNVLKDYDVIKIDGELYVDLNQLKKILLRYNDESTKGYLSEVVRNDTELQTYGITIDERFKKENIETSFMREYNSYKEEVGSEVYDGCKGNNYTEIFEHEVTYYGEILDDDLDLLYKAIDEK